MFDLHIHTAASDGTLSPAQLVELSVRLGLGCIAITDHDTTGGVAEALKASEHLPLKVIPGIELSIDDHRSEVHILGYFIDHENQALKKRLSLLQQGREGRVNLMLKKLKRLGIGIDRKAVEKFSSGDSVGRPHVAKAMIELGTVKTLEEAFQKYLSKGAACYVPRAKITSEEAICLIIQAGGVAVLAHPGYVGGLSEIFPELLRAGLDGIEAYYPTHNPAQTRHFIDMGMKNRIAITAGTDFHGPGVNMIERPGCTNVPNRVLNQFLDYCNHRTGKAV